MRATRWVIDLESLWMVATVLLKLTGTQVPIDVKEASNVQCGSRRLEARQFMFNADAGSRVQLEETRESSSRGSHRRRSIHTSSNSGSRTDLPMDFTTKRNKGDAFLLFCLCPCHALIRCPEETKANQRHRMNTPGARWFVKSSDIMLTRASLAANLSRGTGEADVVAKGKLRGRGDREQEEAG